VGPHGRSVPMTVTCWHTAPAPAISADGASDCSSMR
jgi:hypothetical protein